MYYAGWQYLEQLELIGSAVKKKLFVDPDFRLMVRNILKRVLWYLQFDVSSKELKKSINDILSFMDEEEIE